MEIPLVLHSRNDDIPTQPPSNAATTECIINTSDILRYLCGQRELSSSSSSSSENNKNNNRGGGNDENSNSRVSQEYLFKSLNQEIEYFVKKMDSKISSHESQIVSISKECDECRKLIKTHLSKVFLNYEK